MGQLLVRNVDDELVDALKQRAARNRRSTEAEHREILREVLRRKRRSRTLKDALATIPDVGDDSDFERPPDKPRRIRW